MSKAEVIEFCSLTSTYLTYFPSHDMPMPEKTLANAEYLASVVGGATVIRGIKDHAALGKYCIENSLLTEFDGLSESAAECLNYDKVGRMYCKELNWHMHGDCFIYDLPMREQLRFPSEVEQSIAPIEPEFGGLS
jgi:hypothetical protein